ncbi:DinB family protein [Gemmata sp. JC673]|uniref:DinB family protein n=1 Tax=Gemmata algarum TaxID=2975278 RepID=A0ABU5EWD5_9BACT|nr:DinB family protein [Gemmata algarum]MDY3558767.1 DinB family protein [Gemmata algarum]
MSLSVCTAEPPCGREPAAVRPLAGLLRQLSDLIETLTDDEYTRAPVGVVESSIGGHVRHALDHIAALLRGLPTGRLSYDRRDRGTDVERDRRAALEAVRRLEAELLAFEWAALPRPVALESLVSPDRPPALALTSPERELAFVLGHTVHHNALIRVAVKLLGADVPADFGYAPSTLAHRTGRPCVR